MILVVARAAAGVGAAFIMPATLSLLTSAYPAEQRAKPVGIWAGVAGSGAIIGMLGTGALLHFWSWPSIFWAFLVASVGLIPLSLTIATSKRVRTHPSTGSARPSSGSAVAALVSACSKRRPAAGPIRWYWLA